VEFLKLIHVQWDRAGAIGAVSLGALALLLGWIGTSGTEHVADQLPYIVSGGIAGILLVGVGAVLWISADLRDEWRELRRMGGMLQEDVQSQRQADRLDLQPAPVVSAPVPTAPALLTPVPTGLDVTAPQPAVHDAPVDVTPARAAATRAPRATGARKAAAATRR